MHALKGDYTIKLNIDYLKTSLLTDFYEFTMTNSIFESELCNTIAYFDMFFRKNPDNAGFAIMAGLETLIESLKNFKFSKEDISYLKSLQIFDDKFLKYLENFKLTCDIWAVPEGSPIFPGEPILTVRGPYIQVQLIETLILLTINHQSLIATKANRIVRAANGRDVFEFGARRALGSNSAIYGTRAAFIGGCSGTSLTIAAKEFGIPISGTMSHSYIQLFDNELDAFKNYARKYPENCMLLVDTYDTIKSGIKNAIKVFNEELLPKGVRPLGIRIDSGDITYLSKKARCILDEAGFKDCKICASNSLDEYLIRDMLIQGAKIDCFGVGEKLITSASSPILGGVYKLSSIEKNNTHIPKIKVSENAEKITTPCFKNVYRLLDNKTKKFVADVVTLHDEKIDSSSYEIFDPDNTWKRKVVNNFTALKLQKMIFNKGVCCYESPSIQNIQLFCNQQVSMLWDEITRFQSPHKYYVDLSQKLWNIKKELLLKNKL